MAWKRMKKVIGKKGIVCLSVALILFIFLFCAFLSRNVLLRFYADRRISDIEMRYGLNIRYQNLAFKGLNTIQLNRLTVIPQHRDTLLTLQNLDVRIGLWKLLQGQPDVREVHLNGLNVHFIKKDSIANYDFLFLSRKDKNVSDLQDDIDYTRRVKVLLNLLFGLLPRNGDLMDLYLTERKDNDFMEVHLPAFRISDNRFRSKIAIREDSVSQQWVVSGELNPPARRLHICLRAFHDETVTLPYIRRRFGAEVQFDSLMLSLSQELSQHGAIRLGGKAEVSGLRVYHQRLSPETVNLLHGLLDYHINVMPRILELDSTSLVRFNLLSFHPYLRAERVDEASSHRKLWHFVASVRKPWFPAQELFGSLPVGLFGNLQGLRTEGKLDYHFLLNVDFTHLDSLKLESDLKSQDFRIKDPGRTNLSKMSGEFEYTAYENGQPVRTFPIGPSWEHFTPLDSISPLLQMAVMQSEDGAFFYHHGFLPDAMREALIVDLKERRFARGGSTISMQLVKNVFLNRNKNIARKLEEMLIVWLIETEHLTSKQRMYEVYLNIAEWGPLVYGIKEAAAFYFDKTPSQLTVEECIFLASIIPKPKHFHSSFTEDGQLKENQAGHFRLIAGRLAKKGLITEDEAEAVRPVIELRGPVKDFFETDSLKVW